MQEELDSLFDAVRERDMAILRKQNDELRALLEQQLDSLRHFERDRDAVESVRALRTKKQLDNR